MRNVIFDGKAYQQYTEWAIADIKIFNRINEFIKDIDRTLDAHFLIQPA